MEFQKNKQGIFKAGVDALPSNYFYEQLRSNGEFKSSLEEISSMSEKTDQQGNHYFLITPLDLIGRADTLQLKIGRNDGVYSIGEAHVSVYSKCQFSDNPKVKARSPDAGYDYFSPAHVTLNVHKNNKSYIIRFFFDYNEGGLESYHCFDKQSRKQYQLYGESKERVQKYINDEFVPIIKHLQRQVTSEHLKLKKYTDHLNDYIEPFLGQENFMGIDLKEYLSRLDACVSKMKFIIEVLKFHVYQSKLAWLERVKERIEEMQTHKETYKKVQNNKQSENKENSHNKRKTPILKDDNVTHKKKYKKKSSKETKYKAEKYLLELYRKSKHNKDAFRNALCSDCDIKEVENVFSQADQHDFYDANFLLGLIKECINEGKKEKIQYLLEKFENEMKIVEFIFSMSQKIKVVQLAFRLAVKEQYLHSLEIFKLLIGSPLFCYTLFHVWSYKRDDGSVLHNITPMNLSCFYPSMLEFFIEQNLKTLPLTIAKCAPNINPNKKVKKVASSHYFNRDRHPRFHRGNISSDKRGMDYTNIIMRLWPVHPNNQETLAFASENFLIDALILISQKKQWHLCKEDFGVFGEFTLLVMFQKLKRVSCEKSKLEKTLKFMTYLGKRGFDFSCPTQGYSKDPLLSMIQTLFLLDFECSFLLLAVNFLGEPSMVEFLLQYTKISTKSYIFYEKTCSVNKVNKVKMGMIGEKNLTEEQERVLDEFRKPSKFLYIEQYNVLTLALHYYIVTKEIAKKEQAIAHFLINSLPKLTFSESQVILSESFDYIYKVRKSMLSFFKSYIKDSVDKRCWEMGVALEKANYSIHKGMLSSLKPCIKDSIDKRLCEIGFTLKEANYFIENKKIDAGPYYSKQASNNFKCKKHFKSAVLFSLAAEEIKIMLKKQERKLRFELQLAVLEQLSQSNLQQTSVYNDLANCSIEKILDENVLLTLKEINNLPKNFLNKLFEEKVSQALPDNFLKYNKNYQRNYVKSKLNQIRILCQCFPSTLFELISYIEESRSSIKHMEKLLAHRQLFLKKQEYSEWVNYFNPVEKEFSELISQLEKEKEVRIKEIKKEQQRKIEKEEKRNQKKKKKSLALCIKEFASSLKREKKEQLDECLKQHKSLLETKKQLRERLDNELIISYKSNPPSLSASTQNKTGSFKLS